jgi:DNA-3-methyladenine glycosylase I
MSESEPVRCFGDGDPLMAHYHDFEWGRPVTDERGMFERLSLEGLQAGLSWSIVLRKRAALRAAFRDFQPEAVASLADEDVEALLLNADIIRNRAKLYAIRNNARVVIEMGGQGDSLSGIVWSLRPATRDSGVGSWQDLPAQTEASVALSQELRRRGLRFVGPTTAYATMQAAGLVNDHFLQCHVRAEVQHQQDEAAIRMIASAH